MVCSQLYEFFDHPFQPLVALGRSDGDVDLIGSRHIRPPALDLKVTYPFVCAGDEDVEEGAQTVDNGDLVTYLLSKHL